MTTLMALENADDNGAPHVANYDRRWWILGVLGIAQLMVILDGTIVNIALPSAQHDLHFSNADRQWIVTAYSLAFGSLLLLGGRIGDMIGRKRALVIGLVGFAVASAIGGASVNFAMLVIARTVQGAFAALLAPSVLALLTTTFTDPDERGRAFGIYGGLAGAGGALGLLLGGILTSYASWRWTLFINLAFAASATIGALLWLQRDAGADHDPLDLPGLFLVAGGLFSLVFGFSHAETTAWSNPYTIGFIVVGVVLLAFFAYFETQSEVPTAAAASRTQPNPRRVRLGHAVCQRRNLRRVLVPELLLTGHAGIQSGEERRRVPPHGGGLGSHGPSGQPVSLAAVRTQAGCANRVAGVRRGIVRTSFGRTALLLCLPRASVPHRVGNWVRPERCPRLQHRNPWFGTPRCWCRVGHSQHGATSWGLHWHGAAQHIGGRCGHFLPGRSRGDPGQYPGGAAPQLYDGVLVVRFDLRCRRPRCSRGAPAGWPERTGIGYPEGQSRSERREATSKAPGPSAGGLSMIPMYPRGPSDIEERPAQTSGRATRRGMTRDFLDATGRSRTDNGSRDLVSN